MKCDKLQRYSLDVDHEEQAVAVPDEDGTYMDASEVDAAIAELKNEINRKEGVELRWFDRCMEARAENVKLKRALYKACANWAHVAVAFFSSYTTKEKWHKMENKCLAKKEKYK